MPENVVKVSTLCEKTSFGERHIWTACQPGDRCSCGLNVMYEEDVLNGWKAHSMSVADLDWRDHLGK